MQLTSFIIIGVINTLVDICSYALLVGLGTPLLIAIFISTSLGLACSYILNSKFTFRSAGHSIASFLAVTLFGLWVIQPLIISGAQHLFSLHTTLELTIAKLFATATTMVWNFCWYRTKVFANTTR